MTWNSNLSYIKFNTYSYEKINSILLFNMNLINKWTSFGWFKKKKALFCKKSYSKLSFNSNPNLFSDLTSCTMLWVKLKNNNAFKKKKKQSWKVAIWFFFGLKTYLSTYFYIYIKHLINTIKIFLNHLLTLIYIS